MDGVTIIAEGGLRRNPLMGLALSSSPQASPGLITPARDGSGFQRAVDHAIVSDFSATDTRLTSAEEASLARSCSLPEPIWRDP